MKLKSLQEPTHVITQNGLKPWKVGTKIVCKKQKKRKEEDSESNTYTTIQTSTKCSETLTIK